MTQADLFAQDAKRRAVDRVEANADARWLAKALDAVRDVAARLDDFTTDDVWLALAMVGTGKGPHERRAMGAVMRQAAHLRIARPTGRVRSSRSTVCHGRPLMIWRAGS